MPMLMIFYGFEIQMIIMIIKIFCQYPNIFYMKIQNVYQLFAHD